VSAHTHTREMPGGMLAATELKQAYALIKAQTPPVVLGPDASSAERMEWMRNMFLRANTQALTLKSRMVIMAKAFLQETENVLTHVTRGSSAVHPVPGALNEQQSKIVHALASWRVIQLWYGADGEEATIYKRAMDITFTKQDPTLFDSPIVSLLYMSGSVAEHSYPAPSTSTRTMIFAPPTMRSWLTTESPLLGNMCLVYLLLHGTRDAAMLRMADESVKHNYRFCAWLVLIFGDPILKAVDEEVYSDPGAADYILKMRDEHYALHPQARKTLTIMTRTPRLRFYRGVGLVDTQEWMHGFELGKPMGNAASLYL